MSSITRYLSVLNPLMIIVSSTTSISSGCKSMVYECYVTIEFFDEYEYCCVYTACEIIIENSS